VSAPSATKVVEHLEWRSVWVVDPKPKGWSSEYGAWFQERSAAERYDLRPPYPQETFELLGSLAVEAPRVVLDAGCGPGDLARRLAPLVERVDAVDQSGAMLAKGRTLPGASAANLRWIHGAIEDVSLEPPYALVVAGESIHWFDWELALPRFADILSPRGVLALVYRDWLREPEARARLGEIYARHGANPDFAPLDPVTELERRGLFQRIGEHTTASEPWRPTLTDLIGCHHSQSSFVLEKMRDAAGFDRELADAIDKLVSSRGDRYELDVVATITWGLPGPKRTRVTADG
jgi:SAM-dependent methyltransferase